MPIKKVMLVDLGDAKEDLCQSFWFNLLLHGTVLEALGNPSLEVVGKNHAAHIDEDIEALGQRAYSLNF